VRLGHERVLKPKVLFTVIAGDDGGGQTVHERGTGGDWDIAGCLKDLGDLW